MTDGERDTKIQGDDKPVMTVHNRTDSPLTARKISPEYITIFSDTGTSVKLIATETLKRKVPSLKLIEPHLYVFPGVTGNKLNVREHIILHFSLDGRNYYETDTTVVFSQP